jgi:colanic acid biosynthesis glycosyl transferase WcaI
MPNVMLLPLQPPERLNGLLNAADIHILPQRADAADLVMPSKLLGMMASGKAIVATARADTEVGEVVNQVGLVVPPGDIDALCETIVRLAGSLVDRARLGEKARAYVCGNWDADLVLPRFEAQLLSLVNKEHQLLAASEQTVP